MTTQTHPSTVHEIVAAKGNLALAAERMGRPKVDLIEEIGNPDIQELLFSAIRGQVALTALSALDDLSITLSAHLADLEPGEAFRAFSTMLTALATLTAPPKTTGINIQNNNGIFVSEDQAEAARGKLISLISNVSSPSASPTPYDARLRTEGPDNSEPIASRGDGVDVRLGSMGAA